jgi:hypothetical protein
MGKNSLRSAVKLRFSRPSKFGHGLVAQLVERLNGIEEVVSSILIESTKLEGCLAVDTASRATAQIPEEIVYFGRIGARECVP